MNYEINQETCLIMPQNNYQTKIIEREREYVIDVKPYKIMEHSCEYFGSSLEGRLKGSKNMLGYVYKAPIVVEETKSMIFFPTGSPLLEKTIWVSLNNIESYKKKGEQTVIYFKNNKQMVVDIPYSSFENQVLRGTRLEAINRKRKEIVK